MSKDASKNNTYKIQDIIKNAGGAQKIHSFLVSKGYKINIDSIYKWKNNGIPHRYKALVNSFLDKKSESNEITSLKGKNIKPEIISNNNLNKIVYLITVLIISILLFILQYKNQKNINIINENNMALKQDIIKLQQNIKNNYDNKIKDISNQLKSQSNINNSNEMKINELFNQNSSYENILNEINVGKNNDNFKELSKIIKYNESLIYLFLLRDDFYQAYNPQKINLLIKFINNYELEHNLDNHLFILRKLEKSLPKRKKVLIEELKTILNTHQHQKEIVYNDSKYTIFNKIKNLIKIRKVNNINNSLLIENIQTSLLNKDYEEVLYLINNNNISYSKELENWIKSIEELKDIKNSINGLLNSVIYKG